MVSWKANSLPDEVRQAAVKAGDSEAEHRFVRDQVIMFRHSLFRLVRLPHYTGLLNPEDELVSISGWRASRTVLTERIYNLFNPNILYNKRSTPIYSRYGRNRKAFRQVERLPDVFAA